MSQQRCIATWFSMAAIITPFTIVQPSRAARPLNDLGRGIYLNTFQGGLYPNGSNQVPSAHAAAGLTKSLAIRPRNVAGQPSAAGKYVLLSIGMSNTSQEFCTGTQGNCQPWSFEGQAAVHPAVDHTSLVIVNGAKGSRTADYWDSPTDPDYDRIADEVLAPNGLSERQVQAAWVKVADLAPTVSLPAADADAYRLVEQMGDIARALKTRYRNLQQIFFSSRIYGGYATTPRNPEPFAYESGLAVKWLIEAQIGQMLGGGIDPRAGNLNYGNGTAPWIAWGPYLWADGLNPRSDGLIWAESDFESDGTHPSASGRQKVGTMLMNFMGGSAFTQSWFLSRPPGDFNNDGTVDDSDYVVWRRGLGTIYTNNHYNLWRSQFDTPAGGGSTASLSPSHAPEPTSLALLAAGAAFLCGGFLRRR